MARQSNIDSNATIGFEKEIWKAACTLRGHMSPESYRQVIIGLIFLKYVSDAFKKQYRKIAEEDIDFVEDKDSYEADNVFFVPENARWNKIAAVAHTPEIGKVIDEAMREIEKENLSLKDVLPKNYASPDLNQQVLGDVVDVFTNLNLEDTDDAKDIFGRTFEFCLANFAAEEGKSGGQYYSPKSVVKLLNAVLQPQPGSRIYDPCCGSGGMFVQSEKFIEDHQGDRNNVSIFGQESNADTWKIAKMNLAIRQIDANLGEHHADTLRNDLFPTLRADYLLANPPFNLSDYGLESIKDDVRWKYGIPPASNANFAWIQHMIYHLAPNGKIGLVLANAALSIEIGGQGEIRRKIIEDDLIEGIITLPPQLFYSVQIPASLWFISKNKPQKGKTLFIDARNLGFMADRTHRDLSDEDIKKLTDTFEAFQKGTLENIEGFCKVATTEEIAEQNYVLTPARYIGIKDLENENESFDEKMIRLITELSEMFEKSHELEEEIQKNLVTIGYDFGE